MPASNCTGGGNIKGAVVVVVWLLSPTPNRLIKPLTIGDRIDPPLRTVDAILPTVLPT